MSTKTGIAPSALGGRRLGRVADWLRTPIDGASLGFFRIAFGMVLAWEAVRYLWPQPGGNRVRQLFVDPAWTFPYHGFEWVRPFPEPWLTATFWLMALAGLAVAVGVWYRASTIVLCLVTTYVFLLDASLYLNHFYLMCLLSFLLIWLPADRCLSLSSRRRMARQSENSAIPFWPLFLLRAQVFIMYFYAGIAKFDSDWLTGSPLLGPAAKTFGTIRDIFGPTAATWLNERLSTASLALFLSLGGLVFDLAVGFLLIWRRTRLAALALAGCFHFYNSQTFHIGVFPVLAFSASLLFCEPDWPRRVLHWCRRPRLARPDLRWMLAGGLTLPIFGWLLGYRAARAVPLPVAWRRPLHRATLCLMAAWLILQLGLPFRHFLIPGDANWTEEGHRFSWRMMLRSKVGVARLTLFDPCLLVAQPDGQIDVNWDEWCRKHPKVTYVDVDARQLDWRALPPLVVVYEPLLGERISLNPWSDQSPPLAELKSRMRQAWLRIYGREPKLIETRRLRDAVASLVARLTTDRLTLSTVQRSELRKILDELESTAQRAIRVPADLERRSADLERCLSTLLGIHQIRTDVREELAAIQPFALQGNEDWLGPACLVVDAQLVVADERQRGRIDRDQWRHDHRVLVDTQRLTRTGWLGLPIVYPISRDGQLSLEWNPARELHSHQVKNLYQLPFMMHQYARRIRRLWESDWGRTPAVYASSNCVAFNSRNPQTIVDPAADLAAVDLKLFGHNAWILPLRPETARELTQSLPRPERELDEEETARNTLRYLNGQKHSELRSEVRDGRRHGVTELWDEDGRRVMRAEYRDERQHGLAQQWHFNGQLALQVTYRDGLREGPATMWFLNGQKAWEAEFVGGRLNGIVTSWYADGRPARATNFHQGTLVESVLPSDSESTIRQASVDDWEFAAPRIAR